MKYYTGIDVSLNNSSMCVVDESGKIVREDKVASEPVALINWFMSLGVGLERIGLEAGPLSQWLYGALRESGLPVELLETRHVKAALSQFSKFLKSANRDFSIQRPIDLQQLLHRAPLTLDNQNRSDIMLSRTSSKAVWLRRRVIACYEHLVRSLQMPNWLPISI